MLAAALIFLLVIAIVVGGYAWFVARPESADQARLRQRLRTGQEPEPGDRTLVDRPPGLERPPIDELLSRTGGLARPIELTLARSGVSMSASTLLLICLAAGALGALLLARVAPNPLLAAPIGLAAAWLPWAWVRMRARRRLALFEEQFPEAIELIARALRAGHAFTTGLALAAEELPDPVGGEFRLVYDQQSFGMSIADALRLLAERVPLIDARFFVTAVLTQRESGGNLGEILDNLGDVIRQRFRVRRQIKVVTAHARLTGWVLSGMPVAIAAAMFIIAPDHIVLLLSDPVGMQMLFAAATLWTVGFLIIRRLVDVEYQAMPGDQLVTLAIVFLATALVTGSVAGLALSRPTATRRRLEQMISPRSRLGTVALKSLTLTDSVGPALERLSKLLPTSPKEMTRIRRRLARAGYYNYSATVIYAAIEVGLPFVLGLGVFLWLGSTRGVILASLAAIVGYLAPGLVLGRMITNRQRHIRNGLPDALDLLIVCIEAGLALDQAMLKVSEELDVAHPALAEELQALTNEVRAGKPRMEAFRNLADRTKVEDVRALVAMLIQTDRFGTSIAQALRTHADVSRTTRRQHAEERAAKLGVKLVFPLVFCLFPAIYVVTVGPGAIRMLRVLVQGLARN